MEAQETPRWLTREEWDVVKEALDVLGERWTGAAMASAIQWKLRQQTVARINVDAPRIQQVTQITSLDDIRHFFPEAYDATLNWLFLSTSGVHGHYLTLDHIEQAGFEATEDYLPTVTVLAVQPRLVRAYCGTVLITPDDMPWLRERVRRTIEGVIKSQAGNQP